MKVEKTNIYSAVAAASSLLAYMLMLASLEGTKYTSATVEFLGLVLHQIAPFTVSRFIYRLGIFILLIPVSFVINLAIFSSAYGETSVFFWCCYKP